MPRQAVPVRPVHFEIPNSYLKPLCEANSVDRSWIASVVKQRRISLGGGPRELSLVINELRGSTPRRSNLLTRGCGSGTKHPAERGTSSGPRELPPLTESSVTPHHLTWFCERHPSFLSS